MTRGYSGPCCSGAYKAWLAGEEKMEEEQEPKLIIKTERGKVPNRMLRWELEYHRHADRKNTHYAYVQIYDGADQVIIDEIFTGKHEAKKWLREQLYKDLLEGDEELEQ